MSKGRAPKHRQTQFATAKEQFGETYHDKFKKDNAPIFALAGKTVRVKLKGMQTPPCRVKEVRDTRMDDLGRVLLLVGETGSQSIPVRIPDRIEVSGNTLRLIYDPRVSDDPESTFYATSSHKKGGAPELSDMFITIEG